METLVINTQKELTQYIVNENLNYAGDIKINCDLKISGNIYCGGGVIGDNSTR